MASYQILSNSSSFTYHPITDTSLVTEKASLKKLPTNQHSTSKHSALYILHAKMHSTHIHHTNNSILAGNKTQNTEKQAGTYNYSIFK
jgi:hypothetical protein